MQEVTSIFTVSITTINNVSEARIERFFENMKVEKNIRALEYELRDVVGADDVKIENVQHFVMDKKVEDER